MRSIQEYNFKGKKALIRVDFNVPLDDHFRVVDDSRIQGAVPTILKVLNEGGAAILLAHLGRPKQGYERRFSLRHLVPCLSHALGREVTFFPSCVGTEIQAQVRQLELGKVLLLENIRFQVGETTGDPAFAQTLATWGDVYINDAFGTAHRNHASTTCITQYFHDKLVGYLMQKELESADKILKEPQKPFVALIGGSKISDKIKSSVHLLDRLDYLLVGGGVANTVQKALGGQVGDSLIEPDQVEMARHLVQKTQQKKVQLVLPTDVVIAPRLEGPVTTSVVASGTVPAGWMALDIGPQAQQEFTAIVQAARTILWCGPIGVFEIPSFQQGTRALAAVVAQATKQGAFSLIGGGDSAAAIRSLGYANQVSHLSTGGGALLAYIGGTSLPGVAALQ
ncbi:MAG: phosphoglycerate kinase [Amoebophilaceae bacterium]|nr:phosphoglycerate kinase [Amoebophilaceae bacterium]